MTKTIKHQSEYDPAIALAENFADTAEKCPYIFSSNMADAYWLTLWSLHLTGKRPLALHKSTGMSWLCDILSLGLIRAWVDKPNYRNGVRYNSL